MRTSLILAALIVVLVAVALFAQTRETPVDNEQATVIKVTEQPNVKTALHEHKFSRVMVYLSPGRQEIVPQNGAKSVLNFKAGQVMWSPVSGLHTSEVVSNAPVTIVEVEVKKEGNGKIVDTRLDPLKVDPQDYKVEFENSQVRVIRVHIAAHHQVPMHEHVLNHVVVYLTDYNARATTADGKVETAQHKAGDVVWADRPVTHKEENLMDRTFEAIIVEFKG
jgi:uncharacterized RmlC-like cupin family protein